MKNVLSEKMPAVALLLYGCWAALMTVDGISSFLTHAKTGRRFVDVVLLYHLNVFLSLLAIAAGILTFRRHILGWMGSVCAWSFLSLHLLAGVIRNSITGCIDYTSVRTLVNIGLIALGFGCSVQVFRTFRQHYHPSAKLLRMAVVVTLLFILDEGALLLYLL